MGRGLGQRQREILAVLDRAHLDGLQRWPHGMIVFDIVYQATGLDASGGDWRGYNLASSFRRALHALERRGLATWESYLPHMPGQPRLWTITEAGRAMLRE